MATSVLDHPGEAVKFHLRTVQQAQSHVHNHGHSCKTSECQTKGNNIGRLKRTHG